MPVLDATPLETDPQGTAFLGEILRPPGTPPGSPRVRAPRGEASLRGAAAAAHRRAALVAALRFDRLESPWAAPVWLDPSPA